MEDTSRSLRPSRLELSTSTDDIIHRRSFTLHTLIDLLRRSQINGPIAINGCHRGTTVLGEGAQFEVFGAPFHISDSFRTFSAPYLSPPPRKHRDFSSEQLVAIKRAKMTTTSFNLPLQVIKKDPTRGVEAQQIHNTIQEVLALTHPPILNHPNIVSLLGWGYDRLTQNEVTFSPILILEHATMSLKGLCSETSLPWQVKLHLCHGMTTGLKALHQCGIVHSDIKPENILVFADPFSPFKCVAKIADFGISLRGEGETGIALASLPRGTIGWAAPEQESSPPHLSDIDVRRRDMWSCGLTIWSVLTWDGQLPHIRANMRTTIQNTFERSAMPVELQPVLIAPLTDLLEREISKRPGNLQSMLAALERSRSAPLGLLDHSYLQLFNQPESVLDRVRETPTGVLNGSPDGEAGDLARYRQSRKCWVHNMELSTRFAAVDDRLVQQLSMETVSISELFNLALAYALENRSTEEVDALYRCAYQGYWPAQAIYPQVKRARLGSTEPYCAMEEGWVLSAISSGFLFANVEGIIDSSRVADAARRFRRNGGYNAHYCPPTRYSESDPSFLVCGGLYGNLDSDLEEFPLHAASAFDELEVSGTPSCLLDAPQEINRRNKWDDTPIMTACMAGQLRSLRLLVQYGADASLINRSTGVSPLHWLFNFADEDLEEAASLLSRAGADFSCPNSPFMIPTFHFPFSWPGGTPLHWAVFANNQPAVRILVQQGANLNQADSSHQTPVHIAMKMLNVSMVRHLLVLGAQLQTYIQIDDVGSDSDNDFDRMSSPRDSLMTPVHSFFWSELELGKEIHMREYSDGTINYPQGYEDILFARNAKADQTMKTLATLLEFEPKCLSWRCSKGFSPFQYYMMHGTPLNRGIMEFLLDHGPRPDDLEENHFSVLYHSMERPTLVGETVWDDRYRSQYIELCLLQVPSTRRTWFVNRSDPPGNDGHHFEDGGDSPRALYKAAVRGFPECVRLLLRYGADMYLKDLGKTPMEAVKKAITEVNPLLLAVRETFNDPSILIELDNTHYEKSHAESQAKLLPGRMEVLRILEDHAEQLSKTRGCNSQASRPEKHS